MNDSIPFRLSIALLLVGSATVSVACGTNESNSFNTAGNSNKGGGTGTATNGGATSNGGAGSIVGTGAGVIVPPSTVEEDPDTYVSTCDGCTAEEACFDTCPAGPCCVHACEGQVGTTGVACCDSQGGVIPGASCN